MKDDVSKLTKLGDHKKYDRYSNPTQEILEVFPNQYPGREYAVSYVFHEFTSRCPLTGQPDFAVITVEYIPEAFCIETKSLKLYYLAYRDEGMFMETITNKILTILFLFVVLVICMFRLVLILVEAQILLSMQSTLII